MTLAHFAALVRRGRRTKRHEPMLQLRSLKAQDLKYQGLSSQVMHARPSSESPRYLWIWTLRGRNTHAVSGGASLRFLLACSTVNLLIEEPWAIGLLSPVAWTGLLNLVWDCVLFLAITTRAINISSLIPLQEAL